MGTKFPGTFPLSLNVAGLDFKVLADARMPGAITNRGFKTNMTGASILGSTALADGYYGLIPTTAASRFNYYSLDIDAAPLLNPATSEVSITLAKGRWRNNGDTCRYDIRGMVHSPAIGSVNLFRVDAGTETLLNPIPIPVTPVDFYGKWDYSDEPPLTNNKLGCPTSVRVKRVGTPTIQTTEQIVLRIDPLFDQFAP